MAQYSVLFSGDTVGNPPSGFTARWVTTNSSWLVQTETVIEAGKKLRHTATADGRRLLSLDAVDSDADRDDIEILFRFYRTSTSNMQGLCSFRASGAGGSENAYWVTLSSIQLQLRKYVAGADSTVSTVSLSVPVNIRHYCRVRANGTTLQVKVWRVNIDEPVAWNISVTDSNVTGVGWAGFAASESTGERHFDFLSIATNGDTAANPTDGTGKSRDTQAATLVLDKSDSDARLTQFVTLVLDGVQPEAEVTQGVLLVLSKEIVYPNVTQAAVLALVHETPCATQRAQCWTITRRTGEAHRYTTHDQPVSWGGTTWYPCESLAASASGGGLVESGIGDVQVRGIISDSGITDRELAGGAFDGATVEVWVRQWGDLEQGFIPFRIIKGILGKISQSEMTFTAEMLTPAARLQQKPLLNVHTPACRWNLGETPCPVDLGPLFVLSSVTNVPDRNVQMRSRHRLFYDSARVETDGYFANGLLIWTSGANTDTAQEVKNNEAGWITLWTPLMHEINPGDQYTLFPGCNKTKEDHTIKFGLDMTTFGGFPDIPGTDSLMESPNAK